MSVVLARRNQSSVRFGEKHLQAQEFGQNTFYIPGEAKVMSTPITLKRPGEREFAVDSGASKHMMSKKRFSKIKYHTRINGDLFDQDLLAAFDGQMRASVSASLSGDLPDHSWWQATTGVTCGGLGPRTALSAALPAFVASRIMCRSLVSTMIGHFSIAFGPRASCSWPNTTPARRTQRSSCWVSLMKLWPSGNSSGTTYSLGPGMPCRICTLHSLRLPRSRQHSWRW